MGVALVAQGAAAAWNAVPAAKRASILSRIKAATIGRVTKPADVVPYVGSDPNRAQVVATNLAKEGIDPDLIFKGVDLTGPVLKRAYEQAKALYANIQNEIDSRGLAADGTDDQQVNAAVVAKVNAERVRIALEVFGSAERYAAVQGLTKSNFAAAAIISGRTGVGR